MSINLEYTDSLKVHNLNIQRRSFYGRGGKYNEATFAETKRVRKRGCSSLPIRAQPNIQRLYITNTPQRLVSSVQFEKEMLFCRRGNKIMHEMTKLKKKIQNMTESKSE